MFVRTEGDAIDLRFDTSLYTVPEAARLARLSPQTLRNWVTGYRYPLRGRSVRADPVIAVQRAQGEGLSFINLMESVALAGFRSKGVSMQRVRKALEYASRALGATHLLANQRILTDGLDLFWEFQQSQEFDAELVNITRSGQKVFPEAVMRYLREMEWGNDLFVDRWWPGAEAREGSVVVDPKRAFGAPVLAKTGVRTEDLFQRFTSGEPIRELAHDYGLKVEQVEAAIRLESRLLEPLAA